MRKPANPGTSGDRRRAFAATASSARHTGSLTTGDRRSSRKRSSRLSVWRCSPPRSTGDEAPLEKEAVDFELAASSWLDEGFALLALYGIREDGSCACGSAGCESKGKHPRSRHGVHDATRDLDRVRRGPRVMPTSTSDSRPVASGSSISTAPLASRASRLWLSSTGTTSRRRSVRRRGTGHISSTETRPVAAARVWPGTSRAWISAAPAASSSQHRASIVPAVAITSTKRRSPRCQAGRRSLHPASGHRRRRSRLPSCRSSRASAPATAKRHSGTNSGACCRYSLARAATRL